MSWEWESGSWGMDPDPGERILILRDGSCQNSPKPGVSISSSSLLILHGPFQVGNGTGDPGTLQRIQLGGISGKHIREGPSQHRKMGKTGKTRAGSKEKLGCSWGKERQVHGRNSKWEYQPCSEILDGREADLQPDPPEESVALQEWLRCLNSL